MTEENEPVEKQSNLWKPGQSGNPAGRPKGSRGKLGESFLEKVNDIWQRRGDEALEKSVTAEPMQFCKMVKDLLPREFLVKATMVNVDITAGAEDLEAYMRDWRLARQRIGIKDDPPLLTIEPDNSEAEEEADD